VTLVSYLAVLLCIAALPVALSQATMSKMTYGVGLLFIHIAATVVFYQFAQTHVVDSSIYYYDTTHYYNRPWSELSTVFILHITQVMKIYLHATYFDCFMVFQAFGFWGIMILMKTLDEIQWRLQSEPTVFSRYVLFLPTLHYWTAYVGKDSLLLLAVALCTWSVLNPPKRRLAFFVALLLMMLVRAHIAILIVASLAFAAAFHRGLSFGRRSVLLIGSIGALAVLGAAVQTYVRVDVADPDSITSFLESRTAMPLSAQGNTNLNGASFLVRLLSLLFRPMFFDAHKAFGIVASLENCVWLFMIAYLTVRYRTVLDLYRKVFFIRFAVTLTVVLILLLAMVNYNVGLGLRQRTMALPPLLSLFVATWAVRQRLKREGRIAAQTPTLHQHMAAPAAGPALEKGPQL
jgi:hypothetical protein